MAATAAASVVVQLGMCMLIASCIILLVAQQSSAKTLDVGGALGWTDFDTAISAAPNYQTWSSEHIIAVGDVLVFTFAAGFQNVYLMPTKSAHDSCDFSQATELDAGNAGTYAWRATKEGTYYFSCNKLVEGLGTHCEAGQKLVITVTAATQAATTATTTTSLTTETEALNYLQQRFARSMIMASLAVAPAIAPISPPVPVPVGAPVPAAAPVPVAAPVLAPTPGPTSTVSVSSPPAPPPAPATAPAKNAGAVVSVQAWTGVFTSALALVALWL
jgi:uncharacterized cupredoxin-like copper-binding protein